MAKTRRYIVHLIPFEDRTQLWWGGTKYSDLGSQSAHKLVGILPPVYGPRGGLKEPARFVFLVATDADGEVPRRSRNRA